MQDLRIERYDTPGTTWGGNIQPEDRSWILFLDPDGRPAIYWPERYEGGGVKGPGVELLPDQRRLAGTAGE